VRALTISGPGDLEVGDVAEPEVSGARDAVVSVDLAAICGSDLYLYNGRLDIDPGFVLGHEFVGTVVDVGSEVELLEPGDRVVGSFMVCCGVCRRCREGAFAQCLLARFFGFGTTFGDLPGVHAERVLVPNAEHSLLRVGPELGIADDQAVLLSDVLPSAVDALVLADMGPGDSVAIVGAGPVGLVTAQVARALGASSVVCADRVPERLSIAAEAGAIAVDVREDDVADAVMEATGYQGVDVVVEATGTLEGVAAAIPLLRTGGTLSITSIFVDEETTIPLGELWLKGISVVMGIANVQRRWDVALDLLRGGRIAPETIVSDRVSLDETPEAFARFAAGEATKVVIDPQV
jgi:threonine dehydrogenase-like Zn-dependent dehydrogenase